MRSLATKAHLVDAGDPAMKFDFHCPLMSLPLWFGTELESIPNQIPYLEAEPDLVARWGSRIGEGHFRIGLCWRAKRGNTPGVRRHGEARSLPLTQLVQLGRMPGVRLISLQKHHGLEQLAKLPAGTSICVARDARAWSSFFVHRLNSHTLLSTSM